MSFAWGWRSYFVLLVVITVALGVVAAMVVKPSAAPDRSAHLDVVSLAFSHARLRRRAAGVFRCEQFFLRQPVHLGAARAGGGVSGAVRAQAKPGGPSAHQHGDILFGAVPRGLRCAELPERVVHGHHAGAASFTWRTCAAARPWMRALPLLPGTVGRACAQPARRFPDRPRGRASRGAGLRAILLVVGSASMAFLEADTPFALVMLCQGVRAAGVFGPGGGRSPRGAWRSCRVLWWRTGSSFCIAARQACASFGTSAMVFAITAVGASSWGLADPRFGLSAGVRLLRCHGLRHARLHRCEGFARGEPPRRWRLAGKGGV